VVYAKPPFAGPEAVLAYLSGYTHRVAISSRRLIAFDENRVTLRYKVYRREDADRQGVKTLSADEFIRRFLLHVLAHGFHRIRHYGLLAGSTRKDSLKLARMLLEVAPKPEDTAIEEPVDPRPACPCCGGTMIITETFARWVPTSCTACHEDAEPGERPMTRHGPKVPERPCHIGNGQHDGLRRGASLQVRRNRHGKLCDHAWEPLTRSRQPVR
jgi:hypothetical protein